MASKRHVRRKQCGGKHKHETQAEAVDHVVALKYAGAHSISSYRCSFCGQWHVGHHRSH